MIVDDFILIERACEREERCQSKIRSKKKRALEWRLWLECRFETGRSKRLISGWLHRGVCQRIKKRDETLAGEEGCWTLAAVRLCMAIVRVVLLSNSRGLLQSGEKSYDLDSAASGRTRNERLDRQTPLLVEDGNSQEIRAKTDCI